MEKNKFKIFDTHAHYDDDAFNEDRNEVFKQLKDSGVIGILNCACSIKSLQTTSILSKENDFIFGALGIHPEHADEFNDEIYEKIKVLAETNDKVLAIGEIGLDYYWDENPSREVQKSAFRNQMKLAEELNLPVVIHDRDAHKDTLEILKEFPRVKGIVHCFSGSLEFAKDCIKLGYLIGITGVVTFKNSKKLVEVVKEISIENILVETDAPYMAPVPNRGKRNKSDYISNIIEQIAKIKDMDEKQVNIQLNNNFYKLIGKKI